MSVLRRAVVEHPASVWREVPWAGQGSPSRECGSAAGTSWAGGLVGAGAWSQGSKGVHWGAREWAAGERDIIVAL